MIPFTSAELSQQAITAALEGLFPHDIRHGKRYNVHGNEVRQWLRLRARTNTCEDGPS